MSYYALDDIDDAIDATRSFLWPFDRGRWARLALVVFFVGGVGGFNPFGFTGGSPGGGGAPTPPTDVPNGISSIGGAELVVVGLIVAIIAVLGIAFMLVGSVMEFVLVESLRNEAVEVRSSWSRRWRQGIRLFGFRLVVALVSIAVVGVFVVAAIAPLAMGVGAASIPLIVLAVVAFVVVAIVSGLINGFTTVFVVPVMIADDRGVLAAWRRFWPTMTDQLAQYAVYAVMGFVLQLAAGFAAGIAGLLGVVAVGIPTGIIALVGVGLLGVSEIAGFVLIGGAVLVLALAAIAIFLVVSVPVTVFLRYYALFVLGDTNDEFDLIAERRRAVRE